jgi:hypothetical protein
MSVLSVSKKKMILGRVVDGKTTPRRAARGPGPREHYIHRISYWNYAQQLALLIPYLDLFYRLSLLSILSVPYQRLL